MPRPRWLFPALVLLLPVFIVPRAEDSAAPPWPRGRVAAVSACCSLLLQTGDGAELVRLLGVEPPDPSPLNGDGESAARRARDRIAGLLGKEILLETDGGERDGYGVLPAYVWTGGPGGGEAACTGMLNAALILEGLARYGPKEPGLKYGDLFARLEAEARAAGRGVWRQDAAAPKADGEIVYVTEHGAKYHRAGCRFLKGGGTPLTLAEARVKGYTPCAVCKPPG